MIPAIILAIENDNDREFMASLYVELYPLMKSTAYKIVKDELIAEDMVQDSVAHLIRNLGTIRDFERKRLVSYIMKAVYNNSINYYNRHFKDGGNSFYGMENDLAESIPDLSSTPADRFEAIEKYEKLGVVMKLLPEREREILYLKYNMEMTDQEIGEIMRIKKDSVRQYLTRARRNAKQAILKAGAVNE